MNKTNKKTIFGNKLISLRQSKKMTQPELAKALGVSRDTIAYYETKAKNPTIEFINKVANFFNIPTGDLLCEEIINKGKPGPKSALDLQIDELRRLPKPEQKKILDVVDALVKQSKSK